MKKIMENIYQIKLELKNNPLKEVNCYLIKDNISFLIDTGFNIKKNFNFISSELKKMDISLNSLHVLITHMHSDHCGLSYDFQKCGAKIYATKADADIINSATRLDYWEKIAKLGIKNGFPFKKKLNDIKNHPAYEYHIKNKVKFTYLKNDDIIKKGGYSFRVIETPGHSPGHICLYDSKKGILFTGDHILSNISPNIYPEIGIKNPLKDYLESLKKIKKLRPKRVFPAHRKEIKNFHERITELYNHHLVRLKEVEKIIKKANGLTAFEVASKMDWDLKYDCFDDFPMSQKWFATGEALSHLLYIENQKKIRRKGNKEGKILYL